MELLRLTLDFFSLLSKKKVVNKSNYYWNVIIGLIMALIDLCSILVLLPFLTLINNIESEFIFLDYSFSLENLIYIIVLTYLIRTLFSLFFLNRQSSFVYKTKEKLVEYIVENHFSQYSFEKRDYDKSEITKEVTIDSTVLSTSFFLPMLQITADMILVMVFLTLMFSVSVSLSMAFVVISSIFVLGFVRINKKLINNAGTKRSIHEKNRVEILSFVLSNADSLKFNKEHFKHLIKLKTTNEHLARAEASYLTLTQLPRYAIEFIGLFVLMIIVWVASIYQQVDIWLIFSSFLGASFRMLPALNRIVKARNAIQYSTPIIESLNHRLKTIDSSQNPNMILMNNKNVVLLSGNYNFSFIQLNIAENISIPYGSKVLINGPSGSGKSLILSKKLDQMEAMDYSKFLIAQETTIYDVNFVYQHVEEYIANDSDNEILKVLFDDYNAIKHKQIRDLSGGEKQRLLLLPCLINSYDFLFLDEAFVGLDNTRSLELAVRVINKSKTVFCISHNDVIKNLFNNNLKITKSGKVFYEKGISIH